MEPHVVENCLQHRTGLLLAPGESGALAVTNYQAHDGLSVVNDGPLPALLEVQASLPSGSSWIVTLQPGESFEVAPHLGAAGSFELRVLNLESAMSVAVGLTANWRFDLQLGGRPFVEEWSYQISRDVPCYRETIEACILGQDAGVPGQVAFTLHHPGSSTAVEDPGPSSPAEKVFGDARVFPSPFNARTRLSFELNRAGPVSVAVYDLRGRRVRVLMERRWTEAGSHTIPWDGRDALGATVASGVYYWRIVSAGAERTAPAVLVK
jgi:hypothetical protein